MGNNTLSNKLPKISIIVPSFNQGHYLPETLESIFSQDYPHLEVVVMDGGSTDKSVDIIRSFAARLTYWQSQPDGGQSAAINAGTQHCSGDLIAWLNSDDFYCQNSLWTIAQAWARYPERGLYIGNGFRYYQKEQRYQPFSHRHITLHRQALIEGRDYILQPSTFFWRKAWDEVGGLNPNLYFTMDWDIIFRIAQRYPAVLINEFLGVSREYEETKTSMGQMRRIAEIEQMVRIHTNGTGTPGSLYYALEALMPQAEALNLSGVSHHLYAGIKIIQDQFARQYGDREGFPEYGDQQDEIYLPFADDSIPQPLPLLNTSTLPSISIITPSFNQAQYLGQTLQSIFSQNYPKLETLVFDGGSTDGSVEVLQNYQDQLTYWISETDRGPAQAINKGFAQATGEILGWLNSDDLLASGALREVARAFAEDPELDMVFANALYIDEKNELYLAHHGSYQTGFYYGQMQPMPRVPAYWTYVHAIPQPTVFFRRRLLEAAGNLDEAYHFIFDFELFWRFVRQNAKIKKIERTLAFYRIHSESKTSNWNKFLVELYRFSRPYWPRLNSPQFRFTLRSFVSSYMRRKFGARPHNLRFWLTAATVAAMATTGWGNPEAIDLEWLIGRAAQPQKVTPPAPELPPGQAKEDQMKKAEMASSAKLLKRETLQYRSVFCSFYFPRYPGYSGGEIRDFHLLQHLLTFSHVKFFASHDNLSHGRADLLGPYLDKLYTPELIRRSHPDLVDFKALHLPLKSRVLRRLRDKNVPVLGPRYPGEVVSKIPNIMAFTRVALQKTLNQEQPDFLFVSPQVNPAILTLQTAGLPTRLILASYDVDAVRISRFAASERGLKKVALSLEARRVCQFEHDNLARFDGVIAVSEVDKNIFISRYGLEPERVLVIENGVDPNYFAFHQRYQTNKPHIVFVGHMGYLPNQQAAGRLIKHIMPRVRQHYPEARLWIVGQYPSPELLAMGDAQSTIITGSVEDVRPYLAQASVACIPLTSGGGTKYKILEALSAGVPVVCTPLSLEGLDLKDGEHLLQGESDQELADAILRLLNDPNLAATLACTGRRTIEQRYAWEVNLPRLNAWLATLAALPHRNLNSNSRI